MTTHIKTKAILLAGASLLGLAALASTKPTLPRAGGTVAQDPIGLRQIDKPLSDRPVVEVVFAIDTTGSMTALILGAKRKIWSIAQQFASAEERPLVRVGLVAYRDIGDEYVTRVLPLTDDLDAVYAWLSELEASGGGDKAEHVNQALYDAVIGTTWTPGAMKTVFVVGDAPPHDDYAQGPNGNEIAAAAGKAGIVIHGVRCGGDGETEHAFRRIASATQGSYASIDATGGMQVIDTPFDQRLGTLSRELSDTSLIYGDATAHRRMDSKKALDAVAVPEATAARAGFYGTSRQKMDRADMLEEVATGKLDPAKMEGGMLPAPIRNAAPAERKAWADGKWKERKRIETEIADLSKKRDEYIAAKDKGGAGDGFDDVVKEAVVKQGKNHGLKY